MNKDTQHTDGTKHLMDLYMRQVQAAVSRVVRQNRKRKDALLASGDVRAIETWQQTIRARLAASIGLEGGTHGAGSVTQQDTLHAGNVLIEKLIYTTPAQTRVPALLYRLNDASGQQPGLLFLCGHETEGKQERRYQEICQLLALQGFVVLCPEIVGQGECLEGQDQSPLRPTAAHDAAGLAGLAAGRHPAALMMMEAMAALDVLTQQDVVDDKRLMVTGNSGGGLQTMMLALQDHRVSAAAVGTFLSSQEAILNTKKAQDAEQVWPSTLQADVCLDHDDLMAAFAPKPLLVMAATQDFFPVTGTRDSCISARRFYHLLGTEDNLVYYEEDCTHQYTHAMAMAVGEFAQRYLGLARKEVTTTPVALPDERLRVWGKVSGVWEDQVTLKDWCTLHVNQLNHTAVREAVMAIGEGRVETCQGHMKDGLWLQPLVCEFGGFHVRALAALPGEHHQPAACELFLIPAYSAEEADVGPDIKAASDRGQLALMYEVADEDALAAEAMFGPAYNVNSWLVRLGKSMAGLHTAAILLLADWAKARYQVPVSLRAQGKHQLYISYAAVINPHLNQAAPVTHHPGWLFQQLQQQKPSHDLWHYVLPGMFQHPTQEEIPR